MCILYVKWMLIRIYNEVNYPTLARVSFPYTSIESIFVVTS